jgi:TrmH family RNA methyltransferase
VTKIAAITSRDNPLLAQLRRLSRHPDAYRKLGIVWLEGEQLCRAALQSVEPALVQAVISETGWEVAGLRRLASATARVAVLPEALMASLSTLETPAPIALVLPWPGIRTVRAGTPSIVLDRLQDAGNVGTILRSAAAFGFRQVIALEGTAALWSPKVLRAAMGAHFNLDLVERVALDALRALDVPLLATSSHAAALLHEASLPWPCAWALGHEGQGLAATLMERCAATLKIAQPGGEESLNVAIAASVCMYESARQRLLA